MKPSFCMQVLAVSPGQQAFHFSLDFQANTGQMDDTREQWKMATCNLALIQVSNTSWSWKRLLSFAKLGPLGNLYWGALWGSGLLLAVSDYLLLVAGNPPL